MMGKEEISRIVHLPSDATNQLDFLPHTPKYSDRTEQ